MSESHTSAWRQAAAHLPRIQWHARCVAAPSARPPGRLRSNGRNCDMGTAGLPARTSGVVIDAMDRNRETICRHGGARRPDRASPLRAIPCETKTTSPPAPALAAWPAFARAGRPMNSAPAPVPDLARTGPTTQVLLGSEGVDFNRLPAAPGVFRGVARRFTAGAAGGPDPWPIARPGVHRTFVPETLQVPRAPIGGRIVFRPGRAGEFPEACAGLQAPLRVAAAPVPAVHPGSLPPAAPGSGPALRAARTDAPAKRAATGAGTATAAAREGE